jgi:hypothetical protein
MIDVGNDLITIALVTPAIVERNRSWHIIRENVQRAVEAFIVDVVINGNIMLTKTQIQ